MNCFSEAGLGNLLLSFLISARREYLYTEPSLVIMASVYFELFIENIKYGVSKTINNYYLKNYPRDSASSFCSRCA